MPFSFRIDISRCIGCRACEVACVTANDLEPERSRNWVPYLEADRSARAHATYAPYLCHHCEEPPCVPACPTGASFQAVDGRVLVDRDLCIGCAMCVPACPYEARYVEPRTTKLEKCTLCEGRVPAGLAPACFDVCPAGARHFDEHVEGARDRVAVGDPDAADPGHEVIRLATDEVDPRPRLRISGRREDLDLLVRDRPPRAGAAVPSRLWREGVGWLVQGIGLAAVAAMAGMIGLRALRRRRGEVADAARSRREPPPESSRDETPGPDDTEGR